MPWLLPAAERLRAALGGAARITIAIDRGVDTDVRVSIDPAVDEDDLDDAPGIRRIERRAAEIADALPSTRVMMATVTIDDDVTAVIHDDSGMIITLVAHRIPGGWRNADGVAVPTRRLSPPLVDVATNDPAILQEVRRMMGGERIRAEARSISIHQSGGMLQTILPAGSVLPPKRPPVRT